MSFAFVFPGQGSQTIGMLSELAKTTPMVHSLFEEASDILNIDLWNLTQEGPIEQLSLTENTQPALLTSGVAVWRVWQEMGGESPTLMAGHSLGEYTALVCAGAMSFADGVALVRDRGRYMQNAVADGEGAMAAILGLDNETVIRICAESAQDEVLQAVNFNAPGQVVIAGSRNAVTRGAQALKEQGARRAILLPVSIPAHCDLMSPASNQLAQRIQQISLSKPSIPVVHNVNISIADTPEQVSANLVSQLDSPVRWVETIEYMHLQGIHTFIESGPGKVLSGMIKRIIKIANVNDLDKVDAFSQLISASNK